MIVEWLMRLGMSYHDANMLFTMYDEFRPNGYAASEFDLTEAEMKGIVKLGWVRVCNIRRNGSGYELMYQVNDLVVTLDTLIKDRKDAIRRDTALVKKIKANLNETKLNRTRDLGKRRGRPPRTSIPDPKETEKIKQAKELAKALRKKRRENIKATREKYMSRVPRDESYSGL